MSTTMIEDPLAGQRPKPIQLNFSKPFWEGVKEKKFLLQYDAKAKKYQFYPRPVSVYTGEREMEWREASGKGTVYSYTISYKAPPPFKDPKPYIVATIELEEKVRVLTNVINCDTANLKIGMPVKLAWVKAGETDYPVFEPA